MGNFAAAEKASKFKDGKKKKVVVEGREILLAKADGRFYAVDNLCPHLEGNLSRGKLKGTIITCPLHGTQFDITSGRVVRWLKGYGSLSDVSEEFKQSRALNTYNVKVEDDTVFIET
jgi:3-phenylpropionate/trans-cinnamate dioxygenase ferredoxin subunit